MNTKEQFDFRSLRAWFLIIVFCTCFFMSGKPPVEDLKANLEALSGSVLKSSGMKIVPLPEGNDDPLFLPNAIDQPNWGLLSSGDAFWFGQSEVSYDGVSAAQAGEITHNQVTLLETWVDGPVMLSFMWKVSSEPYYDTLYFKINGGLQDNISGEVDWEKKTYMLGPGTNTITWGYSKDGSVSRGADTGWVDQVTVLTLADAIDQPDWTVTTGGDASWFGQRFVTYDGVDAAQTGVITHREDTWMETVVQGPAELSFMWKVSSELNFDYLAFYINGDRQDRISGEVDWGGRMYWLGPGTNRLTWKYMKDLATSAGQDAGWVDQITVISLRDAIDQPDWLVNTGGDGRWYGQSVETFDGVDAAQSGPISDSQNTWMETVVQGPGELSFMWKVSSEPVWDIFQFLINGAFQVGISGETDWQERNYTLNEGLNTLRWRYIKDTSVSQGTDAGWVDQVIFESTSVPLPEAIDQPDWIITTGGHADWFGQDTVSFDGVDAAKSGPISDSQHTWMETVVRGPGELSFMWKVSSEPVWDIFQFFINDSMQAAISGEVDWQERNYSLDEGLNTLRWRYIKDTSVSQGTDAGWVDQVIFERAPIPLPVAIDQPDWTVTTGGAADWFGQDVVTFDGVHAAQTGLISDSQQTWMETVVRGPGELSFMWKVSSEPNWDYMEFRINGEMERYLFGELPWEKVTCLIDPGEHTLTWRYIKDSSVSMGADAGWVDQVQFQPVQTNIESFLWHLFE